MSTSSTPYYIENYEPVSAYLSGPEDYKLVPIYSNRPEEYEPMPVYSNRLKNDKPEVGETSNRKVVSTR
ncbi:31521_t:CDS:2 [Gigaspora margarita]|uniref:31521_t:CDS:1 n=1 Tax=Gigaspora margarita TaxID=4874 RepID=A0ABN7UTR1_GIGMA|nr:31521_t:CDS:2 [Gigaspora margarita]